MAGIGGKLRAIEAHLGDWVKVGEVLYINHEGRYLTYSTKTNRLGLNGINVYLDEQHSATILKNEITFTQVDKDLYRLTKVKTR